MQPAADALALTGDAAPSLLWAAVKSAGALAALLAAGFFLLRWQKKGRRGRRHLEVIDRAILGRGSSVALLRVCGKRVLVGVSTEGVRLLRDLDPGPPRESVEFSEVLAKAAVEEPAR